MKSDVYIDDEDDKPLVIGQSNKLSLPSIKNLRGLKYQDSRNHAMSLPKYSIDMSNVNINKQSLKTIVLKASRNGSSLRLRVDKTMTQKPSVKSKLKLEPEELKDRQLSKIFQWKSHHSKGKICCLTCMSKLRKEILAKKVFRFFSRTRTFLFKVAAKVKVRESTTQS